LIIFMAEKALSTVAVATSTISSSLQTPLARVLLVF
jgi:hypothetical protein